MICICISDVLCVCCVQAPPETKKDTATISAKPQIKNPIGDVTRFMPTSLKVKRSAKEAKLKKSGMCDNVRQCTTMYNNVLQCRTLCYNVQLCATMYNNVLQCTTMCYNVQQCATMYINVLQCTTMCYNVQQCTTMCYNVQQCKTPPLFYILRKCQYLALC